MKVDIAGRLVEQVGDEHAITLSLSGGVEVRIETVFELGQAGGVMLVVDPQNLDTDKDLQRVLPGCVVRQAVADPDTGTLTLTFEGEIRVHVSSDADFEAWSVIWPDGATVVSLPGGGLSQWGARH
jgi:hypothetical protein